MIIMSQSLIWLLTCTSKFTDVEYCENNTEFHTTVINYNINILFFPEKSMQNLYWTKGLVLL